MMRLILTFAAFLTALTTAFAHAGDEDVESGTVGTGIMGVITGLGSIHVNGFNIAVPEAMAVTSSLGARPARVLSVGETVVVEATLKGRDLTAKRIRNYYPLIAPIDAVRPGRIEVLGIPLDVAHLPSAGLAPGDWVAVGGLWRAGTVMVSHLRPVAPQRAVVINGTFSETAAGQQRVGPFALNGRYVAHAEIGDHLRVTGSWSPADKRITPQKIEAGLFSRSLKTLLIEGYMSTPDRKGAYSIYGSGVVVYTEDPTMRVPSERSVFCVDQSGPVSITQVLPLDMSREERVALLESLSRDRSGAEQSAVLCEAKR